MSHGTVPADNSTVINKQLYTCSGATQSLLPGRAGRLNPFPESLACWRAPKLPVVLGPRRQAVFEVVFLVSPGLLVGLELLYPALFHVDSCCPQGQNCLLSLDE